MVLSDNRNNLYESTKEATKPRSRTIIPSPVQLNFIEQLPASSNVDCVSLGSILGDPMIKECWLFNYLFDMDFVMRHFDPDTRDIVQVRVVHGSWKRDDPNGIHIEDAAKRYSNIKVIKAFMPEMFGTHHTKAMVLFRHDDLAQVVILTANFIERDFSMSQAIWRTPLLPLDNTVHSSSDPMPPLGSGIRFKHDLLAYCRGYSRNGAATLPDLVSQLQEYDFSAVRGALIGSIPGLQMPGQFEPEDQDRIGRWGLPALKRILSSIPSNPAPSSDPNSQPQIIAQVSSVASVGEKWLLKTLTPTLTTIRPLTAPQNPHPKPKISIIFPTADSIRICIEGYGSGGSIHMKTASTAQAKQLAVLKPMLCHWSSQGTSQPSNAADRRPEPRRQTGRGRAAPHIKTYVRFTSASMTRIDWAMMTSANLSTQAWGSSPNAGGEVRISSYELGVVVWPALWDDAEQGGSGSGRCRARMVPVFGGDMPVEDDEERKENDDGLGKEGVTVGWRMPYDLPLVPYGEDEKPWCATEACDEPDWMGRVWPGYGH